MKYYAYCRKSSEGEERQALSLESQKKEMKDLALKESLRIIEIIQESKSARKPNNRPLYSEMLENIRKGKAQGILCWQLNRLSRNWEDTGIILQMLTEGVIKEIITPEKRITADNTNDIVLGVEMGQASQYSKELSKNIKRGIKTKLLKGQYPNSAPHFYVNSGNKAADKNIYPDPETAKFFKPWVDEIIKDDLTIRRATQWLHDNGIRTKKGKKFQTSSVHKILKNPVYCGIIEYGDYPRTKGNWEPLITEKCFKKLQQTLGNRRKPRFYSHVAGYRGLMTCAHCGCAITSTHKQKDSGKSYVYYHCTGRRGKCPQPWVTEEDMENQIFEYISKIDIDQETLNLILKIVQEKNESDIKNHRARRKELHTELDQKDKMFDELMAMRLNRELPQDEYEIQKVKLSSERDRVSALLNDNEFNRDSWIDNIEKYFETCFSIEEIFENGSIQERAKLVKALGKNLTMENGQLRWNYRKPWSLMISEQNDKNCPIWWRRWELNPRPEVSP